jgi:hypothetical protein
MVRTRVFSSVLLAAGVLLVAACASEPRTPLLEKKFQRAASTYQKVNVHGQTVYCKKGEPPTDSRLPGWRCLTEPQLREEVANFERWRNQVGYNRNIQRG